MYDHIFFAHIPKTAGTSIYTSAIEHFSDKEILYGIHSDEFRALKTKKIKSHKYIHGHFPLPMSDRLGKNCFRFMFFREPVSRVLSLYNFWRSAYFQFPYFYTEGTSPHRVAHMNFDEFMDSEQMEIQNAQARYLCGESTSIDINFDIDDIRKRLKSLNEIGISEEFKKSVQQINKALQVELFSCDTKANVTVVVPDFTPLKRADLTHSQTERLKSMLDLDSRVYDTAWGLFHGRCGH